MVSWRRLDQRTQDSVYELILRLDVPSDGAEWHAWVIKSHANVSKRGSTDRGGIETQLRKIQALSLARKLDQVASHTEPVRRGGIPGDEGEGSQTRHDKDQERVWVEDT